MVKKEKVNLINCQTVLDLRFLNIRFHRNTQQKVEI